MSPPGFAAAPTIKLGRCKPIFGPVVYFCGIEFYFELFNATFFFNPLCIFIDPLLLSCLLAFATMFNTGASYAPSACTS
jgi:hypothetical protein